MSEPNFILKAIKRFTGFFGMLCVTALVAFYLLSSNVRDEVWLRCTDGSFWPSGLVVIVIAAVVYLDNNRLKHETRQKEIKHSRTEIELIAYKTMMDKIGHKKPEKEAQEESNGTTH